MVGYLGVAGDAHLPGEDAVLAHLGGAGDARLGRHHSVVSDDYVVGYHTKVVNAHAVANDGGFHLGAVHGGVAANLYVVSNDDVAQVLYLLPAAVRTRGVAKAVTADDASGVQDNVISNNHSRIDDYARINDAVFANDGVVPDGDVLVDDGIVTDGYVAAHIAVGGQVHLLAKVRGEVPAGQQAAVPFGLLFLGRYIFEEVCDGRVGIVYPDHRSLDGLFGLEALVYNEDGCLAGVDKLLVFGIGKKAQGTGLAVFNLGKLGSLGVFVALYGALQKLG